MKKLVTFAAAAVMCVPAFATDRQAPAAEPKIENPDSTGFKFTDVKINGSVKDQNKSGTCWAFSGLSTLEDNVMRKGGPELDISEMYLVRNAYIDKAKKFMRMNGQINFAQGGSWADVLDMTRLYGAMPEEAYTGLNYGEEKHSHYEMAEALEAYLRAVLSRGTKNKKLSTAWLPGFVGILDAYLGKGPRYSPTTARHTPRRSGPPRWASNPITSSTSPATRIIPSMRASHSKSPTTGHGARA